MFARACPRPSQSSFFSFPFLVRPPTFADVAAAKPLAVSLLLALIIHPACAALAAERSAALPPDAEARADDPVRARSYAWRPVAIGAGGFITGLSFDPTGATRLARTDVYGAYRWLSREQRWAQLVTSASMPAEVQVQNAANDGVYEIVVAPSDPDRIYMAMKGRVYRSDDGGRQFRPTAAVDGATPIRFDANSEFRLYGPFMAVDPADPDRVFLGTPEQGLWHSIDGGRHWQRVGSVPVNADFRPGDDGIQSPGAMIWFAPAGASEKKRENQPRRLFVLAQGHGLYESRDGGDSFTPLAGADEPQPKRLIQGSFAADGSFFGVDHESRSAWRFRGGRWEELTRRPGLGARRFAAVAIHRRDGRIFLFDEGSRTWQSGDGGERWTLLAHRSHAGRDDPPWLRVSNQSYFAIAGVVADPVEADRFWVGAGTGVYRTQLPAGAGLVDWTSETRGVEELVANDVLKQPGQSPLFAAWDFGIHVKDDLNAFSTGYGPKERVVIAAQQLAGSRADPAFVATNASDTRTFCCAEDGDAILAGYSRDGGRHWTRFPTLPQPPGTRSDDPWRMSFGMIAVASSDTRNLIWAPSFNRSPFFTRDLGQTWQRVRLPGEVLPFTGSHAALYLHRKTLVADPVEPAGFYWWHSGDGDNAALKGLWKTSDGGGHWERVFEGDIAPHHDKSAKLRAVPGRAGHLFFTSGVYGPFDSRLRRSVDGGRHWEPVGGPLAIDWVEDIAFGRPAPGQAYPTLFIAGRIESRYGIWRSTDAGGSWQGIGRFPVGSLDQVTVMAGDPDVFGRVYLGFKGSGWAYGEPSGCRPAPYRAGATAECVAIR